LLKVWNSSTDCMVIGSRLCEGRDERGRAPDKYLPKDRVNCVAVLISVNKLSSRARLNIRKVIAVVGFLTHRTLNKIRFLSGACP